MKAVFTQYPYAFWKYGVDGTMHLFNDDAAAIEFAKTSDDYWLCDTPNGPEMGVTWAMLAYDYASCCGWDKLVLHISNQKVLRNAEMLEWGVGIICEFDWVSCNWTWRNGRIKSIDVYIEQEDLVKQFVNAALRRIDWKGEGQTFFNLLHYVYDVIPFEVYEMVADESVNTGYTITDFAEMCEERIA